MKAEEKYMLKNEGSCNDGKVVLLKRYKTPDMESGKDDSVLKSRTVEREGHLCRVENLPIKFVAEMGSSSVSVVSTSGRTNEFDSGRDVGSEQFLGFLGQLISYPPGSNAFREFCRTWNDNIIWVKGNSLQRDDEEPLDLQFRTVKQSMKSQVERKEYLLGEIAKDTELDTALEGLSLSRKKRVDSRSKKCCVNLNKAEDENYAANLSTQFPRGGRNNRAFILPSSTSDSDVTVRSTFTPVMLIGPAEVARLSNNKTPLSDDGVQVPHFTHGDRTVKIIDCQTGSCLKVLSGHRRTPWVVSFHPLHPEILASGSLDHEVRLWDANTAECIGSRDFYRPIASIAFHAQGDVLVVASGHERGEASSPTIVLKTRRSLRVVHFHPHAAPFLLTAEVNDLDSPDSPMALAAFVGYPLYPPLAAFVGYPLYPPPAVFFANVHSGVQYNLETNVSPVPAPFFFRPTLARDEGRTSNRYVNRDVESDASLQPQMDAVLGSHLDYLLSSMDISPLVPSSSHPVQDDTTYNSTSNETKNAVFEFTIDSTIDMETTEE
ncbi:hypothetical protein GIB67_003201 [Kingdonia uniflora]|uniref:Transducin/WD40 repeat-like superfamily protein n=1 Tax=Kingdonia uniflora TaxID=39325 RepID=A0A7J7LH25_9MAGN|nr:hypothetical protein GIB67_003201 [Kingdonia uniflora]